MSYENTILDNNKTNTISAEIIIETTRYADLKCDDLDNVLRFANNKIELSEFSHVKLADDGLIVENPDIVFDLKEIDRVVVSIANKPEHFGFAMVPDQDVLIRVEIVPKDNENIIVLLDALASAIPIMNWLRDHQVDFVDEGQLCTKLSITDDLEKRIKEIAQELDEDDPKYLYNYKK